MHPSRSLVALVLSAALSGAASAQGQPVTWTGTATTGTEAFSGSPAQPSWLWELLGVQAKRGRSSFDVEGIASRRFDEWDQAVAAETYIGLAPSNYAWLRVQYSPSANSLPTTDVTGEFFQTFAKEFEASVNVRRMTYSNSGTTTAALGLAWTHGSNYLRGRYIALMQRGGGLVSAVLLTERRYGKDPETYVEGGFSTGHEVVNIGPDQSYDIRASNAGYLRGQRFVTRHLGLAGLVSVTKQSGIATRTGFYVSVMPRW